MTAKAPSYVGRVVVVTGGGGVLGSALASGFAGAGARVAVVDRRPEAGEARAAAIRAAGGEALALVGDVLDRTAVEGIRDRILEAWGRVDVLVNAAGGNVARARSDDRPVFEVPMDAFDEVLRLNLHGTVVPTLVFGEVMAHQGTGCVLNISSMAAPRALSGVMGYSAAKAGIDNVTRWLAVDLARRYGEGIRVNAIAPGFFLTEQNRAVMVDATGEPTARARTVIAHTPMGRLGHPQELVGVSLWLCGDDASFVTGVVIPVDGGFSAFGGV
jgi:NAD(P)-dependent dehydrogenase (short-subunit alcohol dehydrogenase family)